MITPIVDHYYIVRRYGKLIEARLLSIQRTEAIHYSPNRTLRACTRYWFYNTGTKHNFILKSRVPIKREVVKYYQTTAV